jgi:hypothetical protein
MLLLKLMGPLSSNRAPWNVPSMVLLEMTVWALLTKLSIPIGPPLAAFGSSVPSLMMFLVMVTMSLELGSARPIIIGSPLV